MRLRGRNYNEEVEKRERKKALHPIIIYGFDQGRVKDFVVRQQQSENSILPRNDK